MSGSYRICACGKAGTKACERCKNNENKTFAIGIWTMSKYYKAEDVIRKRAEDLADTSYWEYGNPKNVDDWIEVAEMEFKDLPTIEVSEEELRKKYKDFYEQGKFDALVEVSEDCISRAEVLSIISDCQDINDKGKYNTLAEVFNKVLNAPSVVPSRAEGEWHRVSADKYVQHAYHHFRCSECGEDTIGEPNYCPNCGAKMKGAECQSEK